jgi:GT2 family glycosyltransferase
MIEKNILASIIVLCYNSKVDLGECIPSLLSQSYRDFELILVDNASTDGTEEFIRINYPEIKVLQTGKNVGYAAGNNLGFEISLGKYVVIVNPDTIADSEWLTELIKPFESDETIAATTSKILKYDQRDRINTCANTSHLTGLTFCRGLDRPASEFNNDQIVSAVSGCSFAMRSDIFRSLNGFDPDFFLYQEDADISWRIRFGGKKIIYAPKSIIYHKFLLSITPWKEFYLERNRYLILLKNFDSITLLLLLPALMVTEIVTMGHAVLNGPKYIMSKLLAYIWIIKNINAVLTKRHETLSKKMIPDNEFFTFLDWRIPFEQVIKNSKISKTADIFFNTFFYTYLILLKKIHSFSIKPNKGKGLKVTA